MPLRRLAPTLSVLAACLAAAAPRALADAESARATFAETCASCHGEAGVSEMEDTPSLAGQQDLFVQWQLLFFKAGKRASDVMRPMAEPLDNAAIRGLGAYIGKLAPPPPPAAGSDPNPAMTEVGGRLAAANRCASCHGEDLAGAKAVPRIAHQREEYLLKSLRDYKSGARAGGGMAAMADVTYPLDDEALQALAHFVAFKP